MRYINRLCSIFSSFSRSRPLPLNLLLTKLLTAAAAAAPLRDGEEAKSITWPHTKTALTTDAHVEDAQASLKFYIYPLHYIQTYMHKRTQLERPNLRSVVFGGREINRKRERVSGWVWISDNVTIQSIHPSIHLFLVLTYRDVPQWMGYYYVIVVPGPPTATSSTIHYIFIIMAI